DVYGLALRPDGTISAVVQEILAAQQFSQWFIVQLGADGTQQGRAPFKTAGTSFALTPGGWVAAVSEFQTAGSPSLVRLEANGNVAGSASWNYGQTRRMIADGNGIVAIVCNTIDGPPCWIVRAGPDGKVRWQSQPVNATDIARTPDGQVAAILWSDDLLSSRLVRFADP
ncbi:hypothetical protein B7486_75105, partial [cyanobacterium TDX16]